MNKKLLFTGSILLCIVFMGLASRLDFWLQTTGKPLSTYEGGQRNVSGFPSSSSSAFQRVSRFPKVKTVNCPLLWKGDTNETIRALATQKKFPRRYRPRGEIRNLTWDCDQYIQDGGFNLANVSQEELSFPVAFSMMVYRDVDQVERLLRAIYRPHNVYCIHVDIKSPFLVRQTLQLVASCLTNVFISDIAEDVRWGQWTNLYPDVLCMRQVWPQKVKWKYFINLTGQEFPLKTNKELVRILTAFRGANAISGDSTRNNERWKRFLPAPYHLTIYKEATHIVASRAFVHYLLHSNVGKALLKWVRKTAHPDESYYNTLNHNHKLGVFGSSTVNHTKPVPCDPFNRYKLWYLPTRPCAGKWTRGICHFGIGDLWRLTASPQLFCNKFTYEYQPLTYDCLEEWYFHKVELEQTGSPPPLNISLYANHKFVQTAYRGKVKIW